MKKEQNITLGLIFAIVLFYNSCKTDKNELCSTKNGLYNYSVFNHFNSLNLYLKTLLKNGYFADFVFRLMPFKKFQRLNFIFELSPYINKDINGGNLRSRLGLSIKL